MLFATISLQFLKLFLKSLIFFNRADKQYAYNPVQSAAFNRTTGHLGNGIANGAVSAVAGLNGSVASPQSPSEPAKIRRENVMTELITTEGRYVQDLKEVLVRILK